MLPEVDEFDTNWHALVDEKLQAGDARMGRLEHSLAENTRSTNAIEANTKDLVEAFDNLKGALKVLNTIGMAAKPVGFIAAAAVSCFTAFTAAKAILAGFVR